MDSIRVGDFDLYPSERVLAAAGKPVEIGARAFDMLLVLVESPGRLVTKATLLDRVWPRLVVDENNLAAQIASLRRVLGAGAIRTVPGFGYRLELRVSRGGRSGPGSRSKPWGLRRKLLGGLTSRWRLGPGMRVGVAADPRERVPRLSVPRRTWPNRLGPLVGRDDEVRTCKRRWHARAW